MPRIPMSLLLHLLRTNGRGRRFVARHRRHGVAGLRRFRRHMRDLRRSRRGGWNRQDLRRHHRNGARPSNQPAPLHPEVPAWLLAGPAAQRPGADGIDPALMAPPPPFWCPEHGWVVCPLHEYGSAAGVDVVGQSPTSVFEFGSTSAVVADAIVAALFLPSPTPAVVEMEGDALAYISAPAGASSFELGSGTDGSRNHTAVPRVASLVPALEDWLLAGPAAPRMHVASVMVALPPGNSGNGSERAGADGAQADMSASLAFTAVDVNAAASPLPSPTPAIPPPSPRTGARRRLMALSLPQPRPLAASPSSRHGRRAGSWSPAALGLSNGVAPGTQLAGESSDEDERGGSHSHRR